MKPFWSAPTTDIWHVGIAPRPIGQFLSDPDLSDVTWLPPLQNFRFIADPFGLWHNDTLWVFVEALDYRVKRGEIHYYCLDRSLKISAQGVALTASHHLSYPYLIRHQDATYMLPEAHRSGALTLYRAEHFPDRWVPVKRLLELPAIDASVVHHADRWWMFFALPGEPQRALNELHVAYADDLLGPWTLHPRNPVRTGLESSRPGGTPFVREDVLYLPTQDCRRDYGAAMSLLRIDTLTVDHVETTLTASLSPASLPSPYTQGFHTLSSAGDITLVDGKRILHSHQRRLINVERKLRRLLP